MSCEQRPSVTLWGTTQVTTRTTVLSTITRPDAPRTTSSVTATTCDGDGNCGVVARPTVIVGEADLQFETITTETVVTNVIPVQTRYHECPSEVNDSLTIQPGPTSEVASQTEEISISNDSLTITNTVPAPTTSASPTPSSSSRDTAPPRPSTPLSSATRVVDESSTMEPTVSVDFSSFEATRTDDDLSTVASDTHALPPTSSAAGGRGSDEVATSEQGLSPSEIAGVSIGSILGAILLIVFCLRFRRSRPSRSAREEDQEETYWQRRFQELEGGTEKLTDGPAKGDSPRDEEGTHHKHFTLNLVSQHPIIDRPASRLSQISSFFGGTAGGRSSSPSVAPPDMPPSRFALMRNRHAIDFSRPREDDGQSSKSYSVKSVRSSRPGTERRTSGWPFMGIAAAIKNPPSIRREREREASDAESQTAAGRKGMEWIRTIVSSDSGFGFNRDPDSNSPSNSNGRGLPPPPRSRGVSPLPPHLAGARGATPDLPTTDPSANRSMPRVSAFPDLKPANTLSPPPPVYRQDQNDDDDDDDRVLVGAPVDKDGSAGGSRQLYPSNSLRRKRQNKGLPVLDIELNKDAVSPNLWIDDETLDKFGRRSVVQREQLLRRGEPHPPPPPPPPPPVHLPPPADQSKRPAPSAYNAPTELMSRFSPDSSRGSFQQHQRKASDESSTKTKELPPPPPPAEATHSTPRAQPSSSSKRFERSAVTPQLPTLATSNADAFRAEMAELSASTGGSEREERVISFHESSDKRR